MTDTNAPLLDQTRANAILEDVVASTIKVQRDDESSDKEMDAVATLLAAFGEAAAPVVSHLIFRAMVAGHELGAMDAAGQSDRADLLISALRKVHQPEQFNDCVEDGDHYPCKTARVLNLVGGDDPHVSGIDDIEKFANGETSA